MLKHVAAVMILSTPALAHPGHGIEGGFASGLLHPVSGLDHLLVMVTIGLIAGSSSSIGWRAPAAFLAAMSAGFVQQTFAAAVPLAEVMVAASAIALGLALAFAARLPAALSLAAAAAFGFFHGYVHGLGSGDHGPLGYAVGFLVSTAALHALGYGIAFLTRRSSFGGFQPVLGGLVAVAGLTLVIWQAV